MNENMRIDIVTLFPAMVEPALTTSMLGRARARGLVDIRVVNLRDYATGKHRVTDDYQFGGGGGMVLKPEPIAVAEILVTTTWLLAVWMSRRPLPMRTPWFMVLLAVNCTLIAATGLMFGPLLVMPMFAVGSLAAYLAQPNGYPAWVIVVAHGAPFAALLALEWMGVVPSTTSFDNGALVLTAPVMDLDPAVTTAVYASAIGAQFLNTIMATLAGRGSQERAQNLVHAQKWHLDQLLP